MIHNLPWHPVNIASCLAQELCLAELAGWARPSLQMCFCSPVVVCCVPQPSVCAKISVFAAGALCWESHTSCATSHPPVLPLHCTVVPRLALCRSYRLMSLLRHTEPGSKSAKCKRKIFNWLQEVVFKSFGKSWDEGQEVKCNVRWVFPK